MGGWGWVLVRGGKVLDVAWGGSGLVFGGSGRIFATEREWGWRLGRRF